VLHRANGLTDEQLKTGLTTNPDVKSCKSRAKCVESSW
jgi:hypothetical protein